jgi:predicted NodU family carbamoyl transferase
MSPSWILGISAFYHDSAACLLRDGEIMAAAQEERFDGFYDTRFSSSSAFSRSGPPLPRHRAV